MPETFTKSKIEDYYTSLRIRKSIIQQQIKHGGTITPTAADMNPEIIHRLEGELTALRSILQELELLFDIQNPNNLN